MTVSLTSVPDAAVKAGVVLMAASCTAKEEASTRSKASKT
jgi:hypothetical protein